jgi:colanic acid biosynthesis glycosyl transferase WcaI
MNRVSPARESKRVRCDLLIVTNWFPPEAAPFGYMMDEMAEFLSARGRTVDVITSCPNHPQGRVFPGWNNRLLQIAHPRPRMRVMRLGIWQAARKREGFTRGSLNRAVNFLWFSCASVVVALRSRPKVVFAVLQPLTVALPLILYSRLVGAKLVFNVQDLHPDALVSTGVLRNSWLIRVLRGVERIAYRHASALTVISEGFREHCVRRGSDPARVTVIPNWIDLNELRPQRRSPVLAAELGIGEAGFVILFAGTIGLASGAEVLLDAAEQVRDRPEILFLFVGEGQLVPRLKEQAERRGLHNVRFLPFQPRERLGDVQSLADVSVVTLRSGHGRTSVPSKVLGYLAAGRPVIAAVDADCETARFVLQAGAGLVVAPENPSALAGAILQLESNRDLGETFGRKGRAFLEEHCSRDDVLSRYESLLAAT